MRAKTPAESDAQDLGGLIVPHTQRHFEIFRGVRSIGIFKMAGAKSACAAQHRDDFIVSGDQLHFFQPIAVDWGGQERARRLELRTKPDIGGGGGSSGGGATFLGRASRRVRIISSLTRWNLGVPGATPVAATISLVTSSEAGRCFWK